MKLILAIIIMLLPCQVWAQDWYGIPADMHRIPPAFESLESVAVKGSYHPEGVHVHYNPALAEVKHERLDGAYIDNGRYFPASEFPKIIQASGHSERVLITALSPADTTRYTVVYIPGMSADPTFLLFDVDSDSLRFRGRTSSCTDIYIPGDGFVYSSGHVNSMFDMRRKYTLRDGDLVEIP